MPGKSTYWGPPMTDSQFAVVHFDVKTMMAAGEPVVIDDLAGAQRHCREAILADQKTGCRILDHTGAVVETFSDEQLFQKHHGRPAAKRNVLIGGLWLIAGICSVTLDGWLQWRLTLGVILGARFLWVGTVKFSEGIAALMEDGRG